MIVSIISITRVKRPDVETFLAELCETRTVAEVEPGMWIRAHQGSNQSPVDAGVQTSSRKSKRTSVEAPRETDPRQHGW